METTKGLKIIILLYIFIIIISPLIYFCICSYPEEPKALIITGAIAYIIFSTGLYFLLKRGFKIETFGALYVVFMNIFPFALFYILGILLLQSIIRDATLIITFLNS